MMADTNINAKKKIKKKKKKSKKGVSGMNETQEGNY